MHIAQRAFHTLIPMLLGPATPTAIQAIDEIRKGEGVATEEEVLKQDHHRNRVQETGCGVTAH
jgi:hypothetical protein